jgi:hypothetical protein
MKIVSEELKVLVAALTPALAAQGLLEMLRRNADPQDQRYEELSSYEKAVLLWALGGALRDKHGKSITENTKRRLTPGHWDNRRDFACPSNLDATEEGVGNELNNLSGHATRRPR